MIEKFRKFQAMLSSIYNFTPEYYLSIYNLIFFRPTCCTVEDLATDLRAREVSEVPVSEPLPNDLPPKYEELDQPPRYEDHIRPNVDETQQR